MARPLEPSGVAVGITRYRWPFSERREPSKTRRLADGRLFRHLLTLAIVRRIATFDGCDEGPRPGDKIDSVIHRHQNVTGDQTRATL